MKPDAPFLGAGMGSGEIGVIPTLNATTFVAMTQDGKLAEGFEAIYTEMEKVRRYGFTQGEFERAQNDLMRRAERAYANRNDRRNGEFVQTYLNNYSKNTPMPDAETEWQLDSMLIKMINVEAVNGFAQQVIYPRNQVIVVTAPEKEGIVNPTAEELLAIREKVANAEIEAYEDNTVKEPLIPEGTVLKGSPVKKTAQDATLGTTEWTLANGVKVVVKPTTYKADEVRMSAVAKGGLSILSDEEFYMGEMMPAFNSMSGVGKFSATDLKKQLSGKSASVQPSVENYASAVNGYCSPKDLETMMQLLYLNFTQPRFDQNDYNTLMKMLRSQLDNVKSNPDYLMEEKFIDVAYGNNPRRQMISTEIIDKFSFEALPAIYRKLYPDANSFTFTIVGNVDLDALKPLVEKYIGSIPVSKKAMTFADDKCAPVKGDVTEEFTAPMQQPKVSVHYMFSGKMPYTLKDKAALTFLTQALNSRYLISIREEKGGTYGVQVSGSTEYIPDETYKLAGYPLRHERRDGRRAARDRDEGDPGDRRERPQDRGHREEPRIHAQELEKQSGAERRLDELHSGQIRSGTGIPERLRAGDQVAHQRRRTGHGQEGPRRQQPREGRHAPREGKGRITHLNPLKKPAAATAGFLFVSPAKNINFADN